MHTRPLVHVHDLDELRSQDRGAFDMDRAVDSLRAGPEWTELSDKLAPALEAAYQRYIKSAG